ncbi:MAG TPA: hypothetical protein ENH62_12250 [Marinobacter sp.]|nr:hypothetical protein [Marinobacter sp.]
MTITKGVQYEIEFTKQTNVSSRQTTTMHLRSIREVINTPFARPGKALIGVKAAATARLSGNIDVQVVRQDRIVNVYNGSSWSLEYSNNRAWVVWDILTLPSISGNGGGTPYAIDRYDGIDPAYMDLNFFFAWSLFCEEEILDGYGGTEPRAACNVIIDAFTNVFALAFKIAEVGRAHLYWAGDKLSGWVDTVVTTPIDLVTQDSMIAGTWKNNWVVVDELAGVVEVLYQDSLAGYEKTSAEFTSEDAGGFRNIVSLEGVGMVTRGPVVHYAKYLAKRNELIRNTNEFRVAKEGFRYSLGDVIRVQSRPANWGKAYRVVSSTADTVTVDRDVTTDVTAGDVLHIRTYDTITEQVITDTYTVGSVLGAVITATVNWDVTPVKGNLVATGPAGDVKLRRITKIQPTPDNYFKVTCETYDVTLFDTDDIDPSNPNVNYLWSGASPGMSEPVVRADLDDLVQQLLPHQPDINVPWPSNLTWTGSGGDTVSWSKTNADDDITFRYAGTTNIIAGDSTTNTYIYWSPSSPTVFLTTNLISTATAAGNWVVAINEAGVVSTPNPQQIMHGGLIQAGTITAAFAQIADAAIVTAKIKDLAVETIKVADNAITFPVSAYTAGTITIAALGTKIQEVTLTTIGQPVFLSCSFSLDPVGISRETQSIQLRRVLGGSPTTVYNDTAAKDFGDGLQYAFTFSEEPAAGTYTYELWVDVTSTVDTASHRAMFAMETRK